MLKNVSYPTRASWVWVAAFFCSIPWINSFDTLWLALTITLMISATLISDLGGIKSRTWTIPLSSVLIVFGLFWLNIARSVFTTDVPFIAWGYFFFFSCFPLTVLFFLVGGDADARLREGFKGILAVMVILGMYALFQYFFQHDHLMYGRVRLPMADPNALSAIFSYGIFAALGLLILNIGSSRQAVILKYTFLGLCFAGLLASGSRGAMLALGVFGGLFVLMTWRLWFGESKRKTFILGGMILALLVASTLTAPTKVVGFYNLLKLSLTGQISMFNERFHIWNSTIKIIHEHFWSGTGIGTFFLYYPEVRSPLDYSAGLMAHNDVLQFTAETGIMTPVILLVLIVLMIVRTYKAFSGVSMSDPRRIKALAALCALGAMSLHAQTTFNFYVLPLLILAGFAFALWHKQTGDLLGEKPRIITIRKTWSDDQVKAGILLPGLLIVLLAMAPFVSQGLNIQAVKAAQRGELMAFSRMVNLSHRISFGLNGISYLYATTIPLGILASDKDPLALLAGQKDLTAEEKGDFKKQSQDLLDGAKRVNPRLASIYFYEGWLASLTTAEKQQAIDQEVGFLQQALQIDPLHLRSRQRLASLLWKSGRKEEAEEVLYEGMQWKYGYYIEHNPIPFFRLASQLFLQDGDQEGHLKAAALIEEAQKSVRSSSPVPLDQGVWDVLYGRD